MENGGETETAVKKEKKKSKKDTENTENGDEAETTEQKGKKKSKTDVENGEEASTAEKKEKKKSKKEKELKVKTEEVPQTPKDVKEKRKKGKEVSNAAVNGHSGKEDSKSVESNGTGVEENGKGEEVSEKTEAEILGDFSNFRISDSTVEKLKSNKTCYMFSLNVAFIFCKVEVYLRLRNTCVFVIIFLPIFSYFRTKCELFVSYTV